MLTTFLFVLGFILLIKGADYLVNGSASIAKRFHISNIVIGLTIVAFGTSAPELIVNIIASLNGNAGLAIGNILGSNISNILLILGISAIIYPLKVHKNTIWKEIPFCLLSAIVLFVMVNDRLIDESVFSALTRIDGFILLCFFSIFLYYTILISKTDTSDLEEEEGEQVKEYSMPLSFTYVAIGLIALFFGGQWIVEGAIVYAKVLGLSDALIGLTVVAIGTSLPELATSVVAASKKQTDIAIGNVVGSNIFNIFWILGISSLINPIPFTEIINYDIGMVILSTVLLFLFLFIGRKRHLERWQGGAFVLLYVVYTIYLIYRG